MTEKIAACFRYCLVLLPFLLYAKTYAQQPDSAQNIPDTLLFKIQKAQSVLTEVNAINKKGFGQTSLSSILDEIKEDIAPVALDFKRPDTDIDNKNLQSYGLILKDAGTRLTRLRKTVMAQNNELQQMNDQIVGLSKDPVLMVRAGDAAEKQLYRQQLNDIRQRLQEMGALTGSNLETVGKLLAEVSATDITINDLKTHLEERMQQSGKMALGREVALIWNAPWHNGENFWSQLQSAYRGQAQIIAYFFDATWDNTLVLLLFTIAFFIWVHRNLRLSLRPALKSQIGDLRFDYIRPYPIRATLIFGLGIAPFFNNLAPSLYMGVLQFLLVLTITRHLKKVIPRVHFQTWLFLIAGYALLLIAYGINGDLLLYRIFLLGLNIMFVILGWHMFTQLKINRLPRKYTRAVVIFFILLNALAILLNVFGRLSLARSLGIAGATGLIQLTGLVVWIQIILNALDLQLKISACNGGLLSRLNQDKIRTFAKKMLSIVAVALWLIGFLINMNLIAQTATFLHALLAQQRTLGSIHFSWGNVLFFLLIIYVANKLQKNIPVLFGDGNLSYSGRVEQKSSKIALIRLIIIFLAFLLALTASGLPMDRITVVLGALGVGIGLGMQNIVNNFVSGIILIFERPFRIGDFVELADKKGRVKDIGIRSSILLTEQGSEVIIPNGDLLSGRLVNWTLSHDYVKTEFLFKVSTETNLDTLKKLVTQQLGQTKHSMNHLQTEVFVNAIAAGSMEIKVMAWVENIYRESAFRSTFMIGLLKLLNKNEIKLL